MTHKLSGRHALSVLVPILLPLGCMAVARGANESFGCLIEPSSVIDLSTREEGVIEAILVDRGDLVHAGQELVRMEADVEQATVDLAEARAQMAAELEERRNDVGLAQRELERIDNLFERKAVSYSDRDRAENEAQRAKLRLRQTEHDQRLAVLELERARKLLKRRTLVSPVIGIVIERLLEPGESVEQATILRIAEVDPLNVEVILPVERFGGVRLGQTADILPRYPGAMPHRATVVVVDSIVDSASDTFAVRLQMANEGYAVPAGVRCDVTFNNSTGR